MSNLWMDLRIAVRHFLQHPGFTIAAVLPLALGIGANSAIFSVVNAVLLQPLPYQDPDRLVRVWENRPRMRNAAQTAAFTLDHFRELRDDNDVFEGMAVYGQTDFTYTDSEQPIRLAGANVSPALFPLLGVAPIAGRFFDAESEQPGKGNVVILSFAAWRKHFDSDPRVAGRAIRLDGDLFTIVGVMPRRFDFPSRETEIWVPMTLQPSRPGQVELMPVLARLKPGIGIEQAEEAADAFMQRLREREPQSPMHRGVTVHLTSFRELALQGIRPALLVLAAAVGFVLLIACANVANLFMARGAGRERELAVRSAIGAGRWRIVQQTMTEGIVISTAGAGFGLLLAYGGIRLLAAYSPGNIPRLEQVSLDGAVILFTLCLSVLTALLFGSAPAIRTARTDLSSSLKDSSGSAVRGSRLLSGHRGRSLVAILEVALAVLLLVGAGLMIRSFTTLIRQDPGYDPGGALIVGLNLPESRYADGPARTSFYERLLETLNAAPGVQHAGIVNVLPLTQARFVIGVLIQGRPRPASREETPRADFRMASSGYFRALGIRKLQGRVFTPDDRQGAPRVVVINKAMADKYFPDQDPVGQSLQFGEIVGVVDDVRPQGLDSEPTPEVFVSYLQAAGPLAGFMSTMSLVLRSESAQPETLLPTVRSRIQEIDSQLPLDRVETMDDRISDSVAQPRFHALMLGLMAGLALVLAATGIYSVVSYSVSQRTRETGIRMALGAGARDIFKLIMGESLIVMTIGLVLGLASSLALTRLMESLLFEVSPTDPATFVGIALLTAAVVLVASYLPARRAAGIDPVSALRSD